MTAKRITIRPADDRILKALARLHYLTALQLCRLLGYSPASLAYLQKILKRLTDASFCQRLYLPRPTQHGSAPSVYTLGKLGVQWLKEQGIDTPHRLRPKEQRGLSYLHLYHTLEINDFLIAAELLSQQVPQVVLHTMLHERILKRTPDYVPIYHRDGEVEKVAVIPDSWLDFRINDSSQMCLALELDRGTEGQTKWRRKVQALMFWSGDPYRERFETTSLTIAVVATPGNKRMRDLQRWTEVQLQELARNDTDLFRFTDLEPSRASPQELFLAPCWYRPFHEEPVPILEGGLQ